jgi:hypothetical protein
MISAWQQQQQWKRDTFRCLRVWVDLQYVPQVRAYSCDQKSAKHRYVHNVYTPNAASCSTSSTSLYLNLSATGPGQAAGRGKHGKKNSASNQPHLQQLLHDIFQSDDAHRHLRQQNTAGTTPTLQDTICVDAEWQWSAMRLLK